MSSAQLAIILLNDLMKRSKTSSAVASLLCPEQKSLRHDVHFVCRLCTYVRNGNTEKSSDVLSYLMSDQLYNMCVRQLTCVSG